MKKILRTVLICLLLLTFTFTITSCQIKEKDNGADVLDLEQQNSTSSTRDIYENPELKGLEVVYGGTMNSLQFEDAESLYEFADLVVVATPQETYTEAEQFWSDVNNNRVEKFEYATVSHSYTMRKCKVNKVYKAKDEKIKEFYLYERAMSDGEKVIMLNGEYVVQKGKKYLLFLYKSPINPGLYLPVIYQGKYDTEADNSKNLHIDQSILKKVKELYKEDFKK